MVVLKSDLGELKSKFANNEQNFKSAGTTYELIVLQNLREKYGIDYARSFTVENLHGLARLALPKDVAFSGNKFHNHNPSSIPLHDMNKVHALAVHAQGNYKRFNKWLEMNQPRYTNYDGIKRSKDESHFRSKYFKAKKIFENYNNTDDDKKIQFLESSVLGLWMFSIDSYKEGYYFL